MKRKIILWGYLHHTDTFSYIYYGMKRAFEQLGHEVYWFSDQSYPSPSHFDYNNSVFFIDNQGKRDIMTPVINSSIYLSYDRFTSVHKYLGKVKQLVNFRVAEYQHPVVDGNRYIELEKGVVYDTQANEPFHVIHFLYATDLLPQEINFEWAKIKRENEYNFVGTVHIPRPNAPPLHQDFIEIVQQNGIQFNHYNPWVEPVSEEKHVEYLQRSIFVPDFRPAEQKVNLYTSDRIMKAISYGCPVTSDCEYAKNFIDSELLTSNDAQETYELGMQNQYNLDLILHLMDVVQQKHTYINRCQGLLNLLDLIDN